MALLINQYSEKSNQSHKYRSYFVANVIYGVVSKICSLSVSVLLLGYVIRQLGPEHFSLILIATTVISFISLIQLGASSGIAKQLNAAREQERPEHFRDILSAGSLLALIMCAIISITVGLFATSFWPVLNIPASLSSEGKAVLCAVGGASVFSCLSLPAQAYAQAIHRIDIIEKFNLLGLLLRTLGVLSFFHLLGADACIYACILLLESLTIAIMNWMFVLWHSGRISSFFSPTIKKEVMREVVGFNFLTLFDSLNYVLFLQSPLLVLQYFSGLSLSGYYGIGLQINNLLRSLLIAVLNAISPVAMSFEARGQHESLRKIFMLSTKLFTAMGACTWVVFFYLGDDFLLFWLQKNFTSLAKALPWITGASAVGIAAMPSAVLVIALRKLRLPAASGFAAATVMIVSMTLSCLYWDISLVGVCIQLFVCFSIYQFVRFIVVVQALRLSLGDLAENLWRALSPACLVSLFLYFYLLRYPVHHGGILLLAVLVSILIGIMTVFLIALSPFERTFVLDIQRQRKPIL